jgi:hypothetical protein
MLQKSVFGDVSSHSYGWFLALSALLIDRFMEPENPIILLELDGWQEEKQTICRKSR